MDHTLLPSREILSKFKIQVVAPLGGRLNQHWLVETENTHFVLRKWAPDWVATLDYELRLLSQLAKMGWPVAYAVEEPLEWEGYTWNLSIFLRGEPHSLENPITEQRNRGRLLARLHSDLAQFREFDSVEHGDDVSRY